MLIRDATLDDWPAIWSFMRRIVAAGETYCWDPELDEERALARWFRPPPARTFVAIDDGGGVLGSAASYPNQEGGGSHVASASFMVDPDRGSRGVGRALGEHVVAEARADGFRSMQFNAVVEANTRAVSLWRAIGFEVLATVPDGFHHPVAGYVGLHIMFRRL